jgi:hypothetical protein
MGLPEITVPKVFGFAQMSFRYRERLQEWPLAGVKTVRGAFGISVGPTTHEIKN